MPDDQRYVLVVVHSKTDYRIAGFIPGYKASRRSISHKEWAESRSMKYR